jgi:lambda family phage portal protein
LTAGWLATNQAINDELRSDLDRLRARSREMARNNDYARKFLRMVARNVVGPSGIILQARVQDTPDRPDTLANNAIEAAWWRWCRRGSCEIGGRMSFADLCRAVITGIVRDGEALVRIIRGDAANNPERLALQIIDVARLDTSKNEQPGAGRPHIVMGVEIDQYTRPVAYWIKPNLSVGNSERVPADDILHLFIPETAEQVRGIPWMHAAMLSMHDLAEFNRSALLAARKGADTLGFIVSPDGTPEQLGAEVDSATQEPLRISAPGTYDVLPEGYDIRTVDAAYPNNVYGEFVKAILRRIASGLDVAYNSLANDLEGVNYSSIRAGVLEERDQWMTIQDWFIEAFIEPVYRAWFEMAMLAGTMTMPNGSALPPAKADKFWPHQWQPRRWSWVDPLKDIEAARLAVMSGIASPQMIAAQNGVDVEDVLRDIATFEAMRQAIGATLVSYDRPGRQSQNDGSGG